MATIIKAPDPLQPGPSIFLAGSIEMGAANDWQSHVEQGLARSDLLIFNPRRDDWDAGWVQSIENPQFREQVEWELAALEQASIVAMYLDPATKSPISLLEFGLFARSGKVIICCPDGFWRKGNVDIVCAKYGVKQASSLDQLVQHILDEALG